MGLDVHAYSHLEFVHPHIPGCDEEGHIRIYSKDFPESLGGAEPGCYRRTDKTLSLHIPVGPYSAYGQWRKQLCETFLGVDPNRVWLEPREFEGQPFLELINFSDAEGCIGPTVSTKLAKDFRKHLPQVGVVPERTLAIQGDYAWLYGEFLKAFDLGAQEGFVRFG